MGIKNFGALLKKATNGIYKTTLSELSGQRVAIDASIFCYRFAYNSGTKRPNSHIDGFYQLFMRLLKNKIRPVLVFDGKTPTEKRHTVDMRIKNKQKNLAKIVQLQKEISDLKESKDIQNEVIKNKVEELNKINKNVIHFQPNLYEDIELLCELMNVPVIRANGEADALCAKLYETKQVDAIMSEDSDILLYNGGKLIRKVGWTNDVELLNLDEILHSWNITYDQFVDLAILCGTDYTINTIIGLGPSDAFNMVSHGLTIEHIIDQIKNNDKYCVPAIENFNYIDARRLITTARNNENQYNISPFNLSSVKLSDLTKLMSDKCRYRPVTVEKHHGILNSIYCNVIPQQKIIVRTKAKTNTSLTCNDKPKIKLVMKPQTKI